MSKPKRFICNSTKAKEAIEDFGGQIFSIQSRGKDGTAQRWIAKVAKTTRKKSNPGFLVHDMRKDGAKRRINPDQIDWAANRHREIYFIG